MSLFESRFPSAFTHIRNHLGDSATYTAVDGTQTTVTIIFNEQVGALDDKANALFHLLDSEVEPVRNAYLTIDAERWVIVDVRSAKDGTSEVRAIRPDITG